MQLIWINTDPTSRHVHHVREELVLLIPLQTIAIFRSYSSQMLHNRRQPVRQFAHTCMVPHSQDTDPTWHQLKAHLLDGVVGPDEERPVAHNLHPYFYTIGMGRDDRRSSGCRPICSLNSHRTRLAPEGYVPRVSTHWLIRVRAE